MPRFVIEKYETWIQKIEVEAPDKVTAVKKVLAGRGTPLDNSLELLEDNNDIGTSDFPEVAKALGFTSFIPSIRSIEED